MSRPDIIGDAQQIKDVILGGGVVILQGDLVVDYGLAKYHHYQEPAAI